MNQDLLTYIKEHGIAYNTEDSSLFFYALTKMKKYKTFVEFGTGLGCTSFAVAHAMKENGIGNCITIDNGRQYGHPRNEGRQSYSEFINSTVEKLEIQDHFTLLNQDIDFKLMNNVDCVFSDFDRDVKVIDQLIAWGLYSMNNYSSIFIDGLCSYDEGFYYIKLLIDMLNDKRIPKSIMQYFHKESIFTAKQEGYAKQFVEDHKFSLTTIRKDDIHNTGQSGMCWIKIEPNNIRFEKI